MAPDVMTVPPEFRPVTEVFKEFCNRNGLTVLAEAVEKHGSWEWSGWGKDDLNRFVILDLTDSPEPLGGPRVYLAEVWVEADDNHRFARRLTSTAQLNERIFPDGVFRGALVTRLEQAWGQVNNLKPQDLRESYLRARG